MSDRQRAREIRQRISLHLRGKLRATLSTVSLFAALQTPILDANELAEKSPFLPANHGAKAKPAAQPVRAQGPISRELEFRGVMSMGGQRQFSIFNKKANIGYWITENQAVDGIQVRGYDPNNSTVIINMNGRSERLTMKTATEKPLPVASSPRTPPAQVTPPGLPPQVAKPNKNADNKRRVIPRRRLILPKQNNEAPKQD